MGANPVYNTPAYAILALDVVLTTGALLGRIASRKMMKMTLATDDYLTYVAYVSTTLHNLNLRNIC